MFLTGKCQHRISDLHKSLLKPTIIPSQKPPRFDGTPDPATVEEWIKRLQHIFGYMGLIDVEKVACAINQLDKESMCWKEIVGHIEDVNTVT